MKTNETRQFEMLVRISDFGTVHGHLLPESSLAREAFATVAAAVKQLSEHAVSKMSTARGGVNQQMKTREALRNELEALARTGRAIGAGTPGLEDKFVLPDKPGDQELLTTGRLFARDAEPFKAQFIAHAMPQTFLADLARLVEKFDEAIRGADAERDGNTAARASIDTALQAGMSAVRTLDVIVTNTLQDDRVTMAVWQRDRRVRYRNRSKAAAPAPAASTPVAVPENTVKAVA
jgi:hypothetical protein